MHANHGLARIIKRHQHQLNTPSEHWAKPNWLQFLKDAKSTVSVSNNFLKNKKKPGYFGKASLCEPIFQSSTNSNWTPHILVHKSLMKHHHEQDRDGVGNHLRHPDLVRLHRTCVTQNHQNARPVFPVNFKTLALNTVGFTSVITGSYTHELFANETNNQLSIRSPASSCKPWPVSSAHGYTEPSSSDSTTCLATATGYNHGSSFCCTASPSAGHPRNANCRDSLHFCGSAEVVRSMPSRPWQRTFRSPLYRPLRLQTWKTVLADHRVQPIGM